MTGRTELVVEFEDSSDSVQPTRKVGFFGRRRNRKKVRQRTKKLKDQIERTESAQERVAKARHPRRRGHTSPARIQSISLPKAAKSSKSPDWVGNGPRRVDLEARKELREVGGRREFLRQSAIGAGILALGAGLGYGSSLSQAQGLSGNARTVITDIEIAARVIGGVRIATEFIPDPVPSGTDLDPYPGSAIQAALNDGLHVYIPTGTWRLTSTISRAVDGATIVGAGKSTKLVFNGLSPCISAGSQSGWLVANLATDAGGIGLSAAPESRFSEIWINGILTDNRPTAIGGGGTGGFYGVCAGDFVTSGSGTLSSPYNSSAIESAINALPTHGGIVFVKAGVWRGSKISLGGPGQAGRNKHVIMMGEGADLGSDNTAGLWGTSIGCGFEVSSRRCLVDFYNLELTPQPGTPNDTPILEYYNDGVDGGFDTAFPHLGGVRISNVRFLGGGTQLRFTGRNVSGFDSTQHWNVLIERCHFRLGLRAIRVDDPNPSYNGVFRGNIRHLVIQAVGSSGAGFNTIDVDIANLRGDWTDILMEDCGDNVVGTSYVMRIRTARTEGFTLSNVDFGDNVRSGKGGFFENYLSGQMTIRNLVFRKNVEFKGYIDAELGRAAQFGDTGTINTSGESSIILRKIRGLDFPMGTISTPANVTLELAPGQIANQGGTERASLKGGTSGNRGVLKLWDAALSAYRYAYLDNGSWVISSTEPT